MISLGTFTLLQHPEQLARAARRGVADAHRGRGVAAVPVDRGRDAAGGHGGHRGGRDDHPGRRGRRLLDVFDQPRRPPRTRSRTRSTGTARPATMSPSASVSTSAWDRTWPARRWRSRCGTLFDRLPGLRLAVPADDDPLQTRRHDPGDARTPRGLVAAMGTDRTDIAHRHRHGRLHRGGSVRADRPGRCSPRTTTDSASCCRAARTARAARWYGRRPGRARWRRSGSRTAETRASGGRDGGRVRPAGGRPHRRRAGRTGPSRAPGRSRGTASRQDAWVVNAARPARARAQPSLPPSRRAGRPLYVTTR